MSGTITGSFFGSFEKSSLDETVKYLDKIGLKFLSGIEGLMFMIEVRDMPAIILAIEEVEHSNYVMKLEGSAKESPPTTWNILRMNDAGVCLYVTNYQPADGWIFLPRENIVAIHTLNREFVQNCSNSTERTAARTAGR
jgi:hypothetical protein